MQLVLKELELAMKAANLWSSAAPSPQALASKEPFACDSLYFEQWLQFIFIPRMRALIESEQSVSQDCAILPMAEESLKNKSGVNHVLAIIKSCDALIGVQQR